MKKWMMVTLVVALVASLSGYVGAQGKYRAVPGKVTYYNETPRSISFTIVGQQQNIRIVENKRLAVPYNPKAPTEVKFWYTDDRNKREIGRLSVFNGDVYVFTRRHQHHHQSRPAHQTGLRTQLQQSVGRHR